MQFAVMQPRGPARATFAVPVAHVTTISLLVDSIA